MTQLKAGDPNKEPKFITLESTPEGIQLAKKIRKETLRFVMSKISELCKEQHSSDEFEYELWNLLEDIENEEN